MAPNDVDLTDLNSSVVQLRTALQGLEEARTIMLAVEETVSRKIILEVLQQIRPRRLEAANRGRWEFERLYRECEEILAGSPPHRVVGNLLRVKARLQSTVDFFAKPKQMDRAEESHQAVGTC